MGCIQPACRLDPGGGGGGGGSLGAQPLQRVLDKEAGGGAELGTGLRAARLPPPMESRSGAVGGFQPSPAGVGPVLAAAAALLARSPRWVPLRRERERGPICSAELGARWDLEAFLSGGRWEEEEPTRRKDVFVLAGQKKAFLSLKVSLGCHLRIVRSYFPPGSQLDAAGFFPENSSLFYSGGIKPKTSQPHWYSNMFYAQYGGIRVQCLNQIQKADLPE